MIWWFDNKIFQYFSRNSYVSTIFKCWFKIWEILISKYSFVQCTLYIEYVTISISSRLLNFITPIIKIKNPALYYQSILFSILLLCINCIIKLWKIEKELSLCLKLKLTNPISLQPDGVNISCSKLRYFDKRKFK